MYILRLFWLQLLATEYVLMNFFKDQVSLVMSNLFLMLSSLLGVSLLAPSKELDISMRLSWATGSCVTVICSQPSILIIWLFSLLVSLLLVKWYRSVQVEAWYNSQDVLEIYMNRSFISKLLPFFFNFFIRYAIFWCCCLTNLFYWYWKTQ